MLNHKLSLACCFLLILASAPVHAGNALSQQIMNPTGGTSSSDGIKVFVGSNSQVQVVGYSDITVAPGQGVYPQMYSGCRTPGCSNYGTPVSKSMFNSVVLRLEPTGGGAVRVYANNDNGIGGGVDHSAFNQTAQSTVTGTGTTADPYTVVTTLNPPGADSGITVTLTDTYITPRPYFSRAIDVTGLPADVQAKLYWYIDTYLAGGDQGYGISRTNAANTSGIPDFIGVFKPGVLMGIQATAGSPLWDHYFSGRYSNPTSTYIPSATGDLPNLIDSTNQDNGIAVQWDIPVGQTDFSIKIGGTFGGTALISESFTPNAIMTGGNSTLSFTFQNFETGMALGGLNARYDIPAGVTLLSNTPTGNTCPGSTVSPTASQITFSSIGLDTAAAVDSPYTCTISFDVTSDVPGNHTGSFSVIHPKLSQAPSGRETLTVRKPQPVPTLSEWGLIIMAVLIGLFGAAYMPRVRRI